jgi:hypothetical protein
MKKRQAPTLVDLWKRFDEEEMKRLRPATILEYYALWRNTLESALGKERVTDVSRADIVSTLT